MNKNLLTSFMAKFGDTQETLAEALSLSTSRFNAKINERDGAAFDQIEMQVIINRYNLSAEEAMSIFFNQEFTKSVN